MSHEISIQHGRAEVFTVGASWHGLGQVTDKPVTKDEMMRLAGLDWPVEESRLYLDDGTEIPGFKGNYRQIGDDRITLGIVSDGFHTIQNADAADAMDAIVGAGNAHYTSAGALREGRRIFISAKLPGSHPIMKGDDVDKYLLLSNAHDGSRAFRLFFTPVRVVCANTERAALADVDSGVTLSHVGGDLKSRIAEATQVIAKAEKHFAEISLAFKALADRKATDAAVKKYVSRLYPDVEKKAHKLDRSATRDAITRFYHEAPGAAVAVGTWWGAYNAVTYFEDHGRFVESRITDSRRFEISQFGAGAERKAASFNLALEMAGVETTPASTGAV